MPDDRPILTYDAPVAAAGGLAWRGSADGVEFVIPATPMWRVLFGRAAMVLLLTPLLISVMANVHSAMRRNVPPPILTLAVVFVPWAVFAAKLTWSAWHGGRPVAVRVSQGEVHVTPSPLSMAHGRGLFWMAGEVAHIRVRDVSMLTPIVRVARLQLILWRGHTVSMDIPWSGREPPALVEHRLNEALRRTRRDTPPPLPLPWEVTG